MTPPRHIPSDLLSQYTFHGDIPVVDLYYDESDQTPLIWNASHPDWQPDRAKRREPYYYREVDPLLFQALDEFPVYNKHVLVVGSGRPWYECVLFTRGAATITTLEYRPIRSDLLRVTPIQRLDDRKYDVILSISSIEHFGLGRYGDPLNPQGDLEIMARLRGVLQPDGFFILAVPVGVDCLTWNAHRVYGFLRLPLLLRGWKELKTYMASLPPELLSLGRSENQPVRILTHP